MASFGGSKYKYKLTAFKIVQVNNSTFRGITFEIQQDFRNPHKPLKSSVIIGCTDFDLRLATTYNPDKSVEI
jgi:hypothetical protein